MPAKSKRQQRLFGMVHAYNKGDLKGSNSLKERIMEIAKHISDEDAKHFAETSHSGLPEKKAGLSKYSYILTKLAELYSSRRQMDKYASSMTKLAMSIKGLKLLGPEGLAKFVSRLSYSPRVYTGVNRIRLAKQAKRDQLYKILSRRGFTLGQPYTEALDIATRRQGLASSLRKSRSQVASMGNPMSVEYGLGGVGYKSPLKMENMISRLQSTNPEGFARVSKINGDLEKMIAGYHPYWPGFLKSIKDGDRYIPTELLLKLGRRRLQLESGGLITPHSPLSTQYT